MDEVIASDGCTVSVTHDINDGQLRVGKLDARRESERPAMGGMDGTCINVSGHPARATDARGDDCFFPFLSAVVEGPEYGVEDNSVAAARAPEMRKELFSEPIHYFWAWHA
jgi:hypothetical protein